MSSKGDKDKPLPKETTPLSNEAKSPKRSQEKGDNPHLKSSSAKNVSSQQAQKQSRTEYDPETAIKRSVRKHEDLPVADSHNSGNAPQKKSRRARRKAELTRLQEVAAEIRKLTLQAGRETLKRQIDGNLFGLFVDDTSVPPMPQKGCVDLFAQLAISSAEPTSSSTKPSSSTKWGTTSGLSLSESINKLIYIASLNEISSNACKTSGITTNLSVALPDTITSPNLMSLSLLGIFDNWSGRMINNKYSCTIKVIDTRIDFTEQLLGAIFKLHYSSPSNENLPNDLVRFVHKLLDETDCSSLQELEDLLYSHRKFRIALRDYFIIRNTKSKADLNLMQSSSTREFGSAIPKLQKVGNVTNESEINLNVAMDSDAQHDRSESNNNASPNGLQPFLSDSSVPLKVKESTKYGTEIPKNKHMKGKEHQDDKSTRKLESHSQINKKSGSSKTAQTSKSQKPNKYLGHSEMSAGAFKYKDTTDQSTVDTRLDTSFASDDEGTSDDEDEDVDVRYFYEELDLMIGDAVENEDFIYLDFLDGLKQNFLISDIIYFIYISNEIDNTRNSSLQSFQSEQKSDLVRESSQGRVIGSEHPLTSASNTEITSRQIESKNSQTVTDFMTSTDFEASSTNVDTVTSKPPKGATATWQSKIRDFLKELRMNIPLADPLHPRQKATKLKNELCFACNGVYRWPHLLNCFHKFCYPCLVKLYEEERNCLKCPICLQLTTPVNGLQSLIIDIGFAREMFEANMSPFCCTHCSSTEDAVKYCKDCLEYMCLDCYRLHYNTHATIYHLFDSSDDKVGATSRGELSHMCPLHRGILLQKMCVLCKIPVCNNCADDHDSHDVQELREVIRDVRERDNIYIAGIMELQNGCKLAMSYLKQINRNVDAQHRELLRKSFEYHTS